MSGSPRHGGKKTFLGSYGSVFQIINIYKVILKDYVLFFLSATVGHFSLKLLRWYFSFDGILANFWFIFCLIDFEFQSGVFLVANERIN